MPVAVVPWDEDRVAWLKALWAKGMTATQIAAEMGDVTRNAVIGKAHRLELENRTRTPRRSVPRIHKPKHRDGGHMRAQSILRVFEKGSGPEIVVWPAEHADNPTKLLDLQSHHCRWPCSGEGAETLFCGGDAVQDLSYCLRHCMVAYTRPVSKKVADAA